MRVSVLRVEVTLIVAAILNVAVAWGSALFIDGIPATRPGPIREGASHREQPRWEIRVYEQPGATVVTYRHLIRSPMAPPLNDHRDSALRDWVEAWRRHKLGLPPPSFYAPARTVISVPAWSGASRRPVPDAVGISGFVEDARGWPCRSFISVAERVPGINCARTQVIDLGRTQAV